MAVVLALALAGLAIASWVSPEGSPDRATPAPTGAAGPDRLLAAAPARARAAGCGEVRDVPPYGDRDTIHVDEGRLPPLSTWPSTPPASGPHFDRTLPAGAYDRPPPLGNLIHSLEHGAAVIWYSPDVATGDVQQILDFYATSGLGGKVIVAPYDYPDEGAAGRLPDGVEMALVAWHRLQTCERVDVAVAFAFGADYGSPPYDGRIYLGEAPEPNVGI